MEVYSTAYKISYLIFFIPTLMVFISAILSAKELGGTLGRGLKKIAAGSVIDTSLVMTYLALERGYRGLLDVPWTSLFFLIGGIIGSMLLVAGFIQIYKISKRLKLFTP